MDDTISRQAAIENSFEVYTKEYGWCEVVGVDALLELPSAQPEQRWIPCSDRMPDQYGTYLVSIEGDDPDIGTINPNDPRGWGLCDANGFYWASDKAINITAWMPLPESYRGAE